MICRCTNILLRDDTVWYRTLPDYRGKLLWLCMIYYISMHVPPIHSAVRSVEIKALHHAGKDSAVGERFARYMFPENPPAGTIDMCVEASFAILPRKIVQEEVRTLPLVGFSLRGGLPYDFGWNVQARTVYISNYLRTGLSWSHRIGNVAVGVFAQAGVFIGAAGFEGFDTRTYAVHSFPGISIGLQSEDSFLTLQGEFIYQHWQQITFGKSSVFRRQRLWSGVMISLTSEQQFFEMGRICAGLRLYYVNPDYHAWIAFFDNPQKQIIPELFIGFVF